MKDKIYHIFVAYNYKGGELYSYTNMIKDVFLSTLVELYNFKENLQDAFEDQEQELKYYINNPEKLREFLLTEQGENIANNISMYAGQDGIIAQVFEHGETGLKLLEEYDYYEWAVNKFISNIKQK